MDAPSTTSSQLQFDEQPYLVRELQKFLHLYTDQDQTRTHMVFNLLASSQQLFNQIGMLRNLCQRLEKSHSHSKQIPNGNINDGMDIPPQMPQIVIKDVLNIRNTNEISISSVANKLKVFVCKTMQKQSSKLRYNYNSYITQSLEEVNDFNFNEKFEKMKEEFIEIRKKYKVIKYTMVPMYRHHPTIFFNVGHADFFVSFYIESLLFFQDSALPFNGNLLFVPLSLIKSKNKETDKILHTKINSWYLEELTRENFNWENATLEIIFRDTSKEKIKCYSCINFQKKGHENQTCALLRKIRCFVYFSLLFNYLNHTLNHNDLFPTKKSIQLMLNEKILVQINKEKQMHDPEIVTDHRVTKDFLKYFDQQNIKKRAEANRYEVTSNLQNYLLCMMSRYKYNADIPQQYLRLKPKYIYVGDKRVQI